MLAIEAEKKSAEECGWKLSAAAIKQIRKKMMKEVEGQWGVEDAKTQRTAGDRASPPSKTPLLTQHAAAAQHASTRVSQHAAAARSAPTPPRATPPRATPPRATTPRATTPPPAARWDSQHLNDPLEHAALLEEERQRQLVAVGASGGGGMPQAQLDKIMAMNAQFSYAAAGVSKAKPKAKEPDYYMLSEWDDYENGGGDEGGGARSALSSPVRLRVVRRSTLPQRESVRFRPLVCTYAAPPRGPAVRADGLTKSRKIPTRKILPLFFVIRPAAPRPRAAPATLQVQAQARPPRQGAPPRPLGISRATRRRTGKMRTH